MINVNLKELIRKLDSKSVNVAQVSTQDGRTFSISVSIKISEDSTIQNEKSGAASNSYNIVASPVECDTSGCMNSSPDSDRLVNDEPCVVDDFLHSVDFNDDPAFPCKSQLTVGNLAEGITDEDECESIADSDCDTAGIEYFVVDELVGKRFNDKTQKYEFLLKPKRYIPKNEILWNPIDNLDNFDISLLEHNRLYIEVPDSLKRQEKRKKSVLQDKFLSEVNLPSGSKTNYLSSGSSADLGNANFEKMYPTYMCSGSADNTVDVEMGNISGNFEELVPVVPVLLDSGHQNQTTDSSAIPEPELKQKKPGRSRQRSDVYECADCDFKSTLKKDLLQHVRTHLPQYPKSNKSRGKQRKKIQDTHQPKQPKQFCRRKTKLAKKSSNSEKPSSAKLKSTKRRKLENSGKADTAAKKKNSKEIENTVVDENCPDVAVVEIIEQESKSVENCITLPENQLNLTDENSQEIFYSPEIKSKRIRGCVRVRVKHVQEEEKVPVVTRRKSLKVKQPNFDQPVNGALNARQTRKRSNAKIENKESESTLNDGETRKMSKLVDDDPFQPGMAIPNEHPESNYENGDNGLQLPERTLILLPNETESKMGGKPSTCISFPVVIPITALENAGVDVEMLRRKLCRECEKENWIGDKKLSSSISTIVENSSSAGVDCANVDLITSSQVEFPTEVFGSENTAMDEETISSTVNRILDILDSESDKKSKDAMDENNSVELNQRLQNAAVEKDSIKSAETFKDASAETNVAIESQEPKLPSVLSRVENTIEKDDSSSNPASEDVRFRRCTFCEFVSVGFTKYKEHIIANHADKFKRCIFCSKSLMSDSSMQRHQRENHAEYLPFVLLPRVS